MNKVFDSQWSAGAGNLRSLNLRSFYRCCQLIKQPEILLAVSQFHWWLSTM